MTFGQHSIYLTSSVLLASTSFSNFIHIDSLRALEAPNERLIELL